MARKHKVDEVLKALTLKGCTITTSEPITKQVERFVHPDISKIQAEYDRFIEGKRGVVNYDLKKMSEDEVNEKWANIFKNSNQQLFTSRKVNETIIIQAPYTINVDGVVGLGNKSWGKIDFLTNYHGFTVIGKAN